MDSSKKTLIDLIQTAFKNVELGDGIGLKEGQAIDDYESKNIQQQYREEDEKTDWSKIPVEKLNHCASSLSFFDAEGMRFHLPAYLISEINETLWNGIIFHIVNPDEYCREKFRLLNSNQRNSVIHFLNWCLDQVGYEFEFDDIKTALNSYWTKQP